jgi:hypothetical protein
MPLTPAQLATLKTNIQNTPALNSQPNTVAGNTAIASFYNSPASPSFTVWKTGVSIGEVGRTFNATELAGLTSLNTQRLQNLAAWLATGVNPSLSSVRQFFDDIFSGAGGNSTRPALLALWKRFANNVEKLFATGTGNDANPATMTFEGTVSEQDVADARV